MELSDDRAQPILSLEELHVNHPGVTPALGQSYSEAASICLARHHLSPVTLALKRGGQQQSRSLAFPNPTERVRNAYANDIDATEAGAYAVSFASVETVAGLVVVRRAETRTGADWYLLPKGINSEDLETCIRLEVSGINSGSSTEIERRLKEKLSQARRGNSNLPAIASVVGFKQLEVAISRLGGHA